MRRVGEHRVLPGDVDKVSPTIGDVHLVANALPDRPSVSIHVYGANIGAVKSRIMRLPANACSRCSSSMRRIKARSSSEVGRER